MSSKTVHSLSTPLELGPIRLNVADLDQMRTFYADLVGLEILTTDAESVTLGYQQRPILILQHTPTLSAAGLGEAGLYHTAIKFNSQSTLAQTVLRLLQADMGKFQGSSDHLVSEAFYFVDPEHNGLELYFDKDSSLWQWQDGYVVMGSSYIDPGLYINTHQETSADPAKKIGHIHLKIGDLDQAKQFYVDYLGLVVTSEMPGALFVSDGVYHHHIGLNIWESRNAATRQPSLGLRDFELWVSQLEDITRAQQRLEHASVPVTQTENGFSVQDPWNNTLILKTVPHLEK